MQGEFDVLIWGALFLSIILTFAIDEVSALFMKRSILNHVDGSQKSGTFSERIYRAYQRIEWMLFVIVCAIIWIGQLVVLYTVFAPIFMETWTLDETSIPGWIIPITWTVAAIAVRLKRSLDYDFEIRNK